MKLSERKMKRVDVRRSIPFFLLFAFGFVLAPFTGVGRLILLETLSIAGSEGIVFGGSVVVYLLLYMGFWYRLRKTMPMCPLH